MTSSVVTHDSARRAPAPGAASGADVMSCPPGTAPLDAPEGARSDGERPGRGARASLGVVSDEELARLRVVPARHPGRIVLAVLVGLLAAAVLWYFVTNPRWEWGVVAQWFFAESIIRGLLETLKIGRAHV